MSGEEDETITTGSGVTVDASDATRPLRGDSPGPLTPLRREHVLAGTRCRLIPFKEAHISERYIGWLNDPAVNQFLEVRWIHQTYATACTFVRSFYGKAEKYIWGIYVHQDPGPIGTATLYDINRHHDVGEFGLLVGERAYWGTGVSTEVIDLIAQCAFETLGLRRLAGGSYTTNVGMNFAFRRAGFTREGTVRKAYVVRPGVYVDGYRWGLLAEEWRVFRPHHGS